MRLFQRRRAPAISDGYNQAALAEAVARKTAALDTAKAIETWTLPESRLATVAALALSGDRVLDFGGGAGLHFRIARHAFPSRPLRWAIVEMPAMVRRAAEMETVDCRFFTSTAAACDWLGPVDLMHAIGALQYAPDALPEMVALHAPVMLWTKLRLGERRETGMQRSMLSANGPGPLPSDIEDTEVSYPFTQLSLRDFLAAHKGYRTIWRDGDRAFLFKRSESR